MAIGDLDDGTRFGLPAIGLPQANLGTQGSDTERRAFPGLATKSSVFAWTPDNATLQSRLSDTSGWQDTINFRTNTAPSGSSVDVPTWAAGAVIGWNVNVSTLGVGVTFQQFVAAAPVYGVGPSIWSVTYPAINHGTISQFIVPFFDEPVFTVKCQNNIATTAGQVTSVVRLLGFVRNV